MITPEESRPDATAQDLASYLAEASEMLASSLDYQATLTSLARLAVPRLADWCAIDILEEDGSINQLVVAHKDPGKDAWGRELIRLYPLDPDAPQGVPRVLRSGEPEFYPEVTDEALVAAARDAEHLRIMREVGFKSVMIVPLIARGRTLGAMTLVTTESGRRYEASDLAVAEDLARRAALAVDNARLYREAQREIAERERVEEELRGSWSQLDVIVRGIADGVTAQDPTGRVIYANEAAARMVGYASARAFLEAPLQEVMQRFEVFDESGRPFPLEELPGRRALQGEEGVEQVVDGVLEIAPGAVLVRNPKLDEWLDPWTGRNLGEQAHRFLKVVRVYELEGALSDHLRGFVAQNPLHRWAGIADGTLCADDRDYVRAVLHEGAEPLLASTHLLFRPLDLGDVVEDVDRQPDPTVLVEDRHRSHGGPPLLPRRHHAEAEDLLSPFLALQRPPARQLLEGERSS